MIKLENLYLEGVDNKYLLNDVNIFIPSGSLVLVKGEHNFGKTRLLKTIAMLEKPRKGKLFVMGKEVSRLNNREISNLYKQIGLVLEEDLLIDNINVADNILLPLILRNENRKEIALALKELIPWLNLEDLIKKNTINLSASEKKIIQFARAIIVRPRILMLDNLFNAIDNNIEKKIIFLIMALNRIGTTIVIFGKEPSIQKIKFSNIFNIKKQHLLEEKIELN